MGGGGSTTSTNTIQETQLQKDQAKILQALAPYITQYGITNMQGLNAAAPGINQMLLQALGQNTGASAMNYANTTNQLRQTAGQMGVRPGDPRMIQAFGQAGEASTKANLPEVQAILSMFGMTPQAALTQMGSGQPAGSTSTGKTPGASPLQQVGSLGSLALTGMMMAALLP